MFLSPGTGKAPLMWECLLGFQEGGGQGVLLASAVFEVPLTQNNQYTKVAYFGVACPELICSPTPQPQNFPRSFTY